MKAKRAAPPRRRISFAVDRDEIEINSDWVDAVMAAPAPAALHDAPSAPIATFPAPANKDGDVFFAPCTNSATEEEFSTGENSLPGEECTSVEDSSSVDKASPVAEITAVERKTSVERYATAAELPRAPREVLSTQQPLRSTLTTRSRDAVVKATTVAVFATGAEDSTDAQSSSTKDHRLPKPRPIVRITDGLTPGQYAVYSLMYGAGESTANSSRIYKGGYADLGRLTGLSKRGIQNIVAELQAKQAISIHQQPGYHRTETTAYLVPEAGAVVQLWFSKGWRRALGKSKTLIS